MDCNEDIRQIGFDQIKDFQEIDYMDDSIAFHTDIRELPIENGSMRVDMFTIIGCVSGKAQVELNTITYTLRQNEVLACRPNDVIDNCMLSPDFKGVALCLSQRGILEQISESELWNKALYLTEKPIVLVSEDSLRMFNLYGAALREKTKMSRTPFHREIIISIVKAALYELLSNVDNDKSTRYGRGLIKQREILFKRFFALLVGTRVKPRNVS